MFSKEIGQEIQKARKGLRITQAQLAEKTGLSTKYIANIEGGYKLPKLDTFIKIANALGIDANTLLSSVLDVSPMISSNDLSDRIASLDKKDQQKVLRILDSVIAEFKN